MSRLLAPMGLMLVVALAAPDLVLATTANGTITEMGRPIVGAPVIIDGGDPIFTDQDGKYSADMDAGDHQIKVGLNGYKNNEVKATLVKDQTTTVDFVLEPLLQIVSLTVPASLKQGATGTAQLVLKNTAASAYNLDQVSLNLRGDGGVDRSADFATVSDAANATAIKPGETVTLAFTLTPTATAAPGKVTVTASLLTFDTALGKNLLGNPSFERGTSLKSAPSWTFAVDSAATKATGAIGGTPAITGSRCAQVKATEEGDSRAYWTDPILIQPNQSYVLSGYIKTDQVESTVDNGAAVYVPVTNNDPYQQPNSPWMTGTRDWRRAIIAFQTSEDTRRPTAHCRGEIQQGTGTAWFDNMSLTQGTVDGSLTVTGGDQTLEVTQ